MAIRADLFSWLMLASLAPFGLSCTSRKPTAQEQDQYSVSAYLNPTGPQLIRPDDGITFKVYIRYARDGRVEAGRMTNTTWRIMGTTFTPPYTPSNLAEAGQIIVIEYPNGSGESSCTYFAPRTLPAGTNRLKVVLRGDITNPFGGINPGAELEITVDPNAPPPIALPTEIAEALGAVTK